MVTPVWIFAYDGEVPKYPSNMPKVRLKWPNFIYKSSKIVSNIRQISLNFSQIFRTIEPPLAGSETPATSTGPGSSSTSGKPCRPSASSFTHQHLPQPHRVRPYLAHFSPVLSRFLRVVTVSLRRFQRAASQNPGGERASASSSSAGAGTPQPHPNRTPTATLRGELYHI